MNAIASGGWPELAILAHLAGALCRLEERIPKWDNSAMTRTRIPPTPPLLFCKVAETMGLANECPQSRANIRVRGKVGLTKDLDRLLGIQTGTLAAGGAKNSKRARRGTGRTTYGNAGERSSTPLRLAQSRSGFRLRALTHPIRDKSGTSWRPPVDARKAPGAVGSLDNSSPSSFRRKSSFGGDVRVGHGSRGSVIREWRVVCG